MQLGSSFDALMSNLLPEDARLSGSPITHEDMRRCFFGDYADTAEPEPALRKYMEVQDVVSAGGRGAALRCMDPRCAAAYLRTCLRGSALHCPTGSCARSLTGR